MTRSVINDRQLIFVGGAPRSGTTMVQNMLDSHPEILGIPEFLHLADLVSLRRNLIRSVEKGWINEICSAQDVDTNIGLFLYNLFKPLLSQSDCSYLSEKTPENVLVFPELLELFPNAKFIQVVRDPRAVIASLLQVKVRALKQGIRPSWKTQNLRMAMSHTQACIKSGLKASRLAPDRVLTIPYEQIVRHPDVETRKICDFLNLEWSESMTRPMEFKHIGEDAITTNSDEIWYDKTTYSKNPDSGNIGKWKTQLNAYQKSVISIFFEDLNVEYDEFNYDLNANKFKMHARLYGNFFKSYILMREQMKSSPFYRRLRRSLKSA